MTELAYPEKPLLKTQGCFRDPPVSGTDTIPEVRTELLQFYMHCAGAEPQVMESSSHIPNAHASHGLCVFEWAERAILLQRSRTPAYRTAPYRTTPYRTARSLGPSARCLQTGCAAGARLRSGGTDTSVSHFSRERARTNRKAIRHTRHASIGMHRSSAREVPLPRGDELVAPARGSSSSRAAHSSSGNWGRLGQYAE